MERLPSGRHVAARAGHGRKARTLRAAACATALASALTTGSLALSGGVGSAAPPTTPPSLKQTLAEAAKLSSQIDFLSQQYDGLKIQLTEAKAQLRAARLTVKRDETLLAGFQNSVGQIAAVGYMTGGLSPAMQLLQGTNPQGLLTRASIMAQLQQENGSRIKLVAAARTAAERAKLTATQVATRAAKLAGQMRGKVAQIQSRENVLNSQAFSQAMQVYQQTGHYPDIAPVGDSLGVHALKEALSRVGDPYVWAAAGPNAFDCSGLVVWSYGQLGIHLPHFTGDLWNSGPHIPRSQLQPGDLVFFFPSISHVGIYLGNNLMVDAPTFGQNVQVQPIFSGYVGAVRILG